MNAKETIKALRSVIVFDHNTGNGKDDMRKPELYIRYGGSSWEPVFWPNHLWKWDLVKNFSNIKFADLQEMKLNEKYRTLTDFFKDVIRMAFEYYGLDPIDHVGSAPTRVGPKRSKLLEFVTDSAEIPAPRCLLTQLWPNSVVIKNRGDNSSIARAACQALGLSEVEYKIMKKELNEIIVSSFSFFDTQVTFPLNLQDEEREICLADQDQLFTYLRSPPSLHAKNIPFLEVAALASLTGASVHVLHPAVGTNPVNFVHLWNWSTSSPLAHNLVDTNGRFYTNKDIYLITEDNSTFYNLSTAFMNTAQNENETPGGILEINDNGYEPVPMSTTPNVVDNVSNRENESDEAVPMSTTPNNVDEESRHDKESNGDEGSNDDESTDDDKSIDKHIIVPRSTTPTLKRKRNSSSTTGSIVSSSSTESNDRTDIFDALKLLERPSASMERREKEEAMELKEFEEKRREIDRENKEKNDRITRDFEKQCEIFEKKRIEKRKEIERVRFMAEKLRDKLSNDEIRNIFHDNLDLFKAIENGNGKSWRYKAFHSPGTVLTLNFKQIGEPFSDEQQDVVYEEVRNIWLKNNMMNRFVDVVILPEVFIRIYQVFFELSKEEAEHNLELAEANLVNPDEPM